MAVMIFSADRAVRSLASAAAARTSVIRVGPCCISLLPAMVKAPDAAKHMHCARSVDSGFTLIPEHLWKSCASSSDTGRSWPKSRAVRAKAPHSIR